MLKITNPKILFSVTSGLLVLLIYIGTNLVNTDSVVELRRQFNATLIEPLALVAIALFLSSLILLSAKPAVFQHWLRFIFSWYVPLTVVLLLLSGGNPYASVARTNVAIICGVGLVILTIVFLIYQSVRGVR